MQIKQAFNSQRTSNNPVLFLSFIVILITTILADFTNYSNYITYPFILLWILFLIATPIPLLDIERTFIRSSIILFLIILVYGLIGYSSISRGDLLREFNWIIIGIIAIYVAKLFSDRELSLLYVIFIISILVLLFIFIRKGQSLIAADEQTDAAEITNAWYGSLFMLLSGLCLIVFFHIKPFLPKIISLFFLFLFLYLNVFILQRGTNVIFTLVELALLFVFLLKNKSLVWIFTIIVSISAVFFVEEGGLISLFDWLAETIPSERMAVRFREISYALTYEDINASSSGSLSARHNLITISWNTFTSNFSHFVFGAGEQEGNGVIGHHSFFVDTLARYGIIGGFLIVVYFIKQYQIIMSVLDKKKEWALYMQCTIVFVFYVLRNFYGNMAFALVNIVLLVLFPMTFQIVQYYKK